MVVGGPRGGGIPGGACVAGPGPEPHWSQRNGDDWRAWGPTAQTAYVEGFLAGAGFGQAAGRALAAAERSERAPPGLATRPVCAAIGELRTTGGFRLPLRRQRLRSRINDYYWWDNHRPLPTWYAFWEVNASLTGPIMTPAR